MRFHPGNVLIEPYTPSTSIGVAGGLGTETLQLTSGVLGSITAGSITIGSTNDTGAMNVGSYSWSSPVNFVSGNSGSIDVTGTQTGTGNATLNFTGPTSLSYEGVNATSANEAIAFNGPVTLTADATVNSGTALTTFGSTVDGDYDLTAGAGTFSLGDAWGSHTPLNRVSLTSTGGLALPAVSAASIFAQTTAATADISLSGQLTASGSGTPVTLVAAEFPQRCRLRRHQPDGVRVAKLADLFDQSRQQHARRPHR